MATGPCADAVKLVRELRETCWRWERLCVAAWPKNEVLGVGYDSEGRELWIDLDLDNEKWCAGYGDDLNYIAEGLSSPVEALAAIEAYEAANTKGTADA